MHGTSCPLERRRVASRLLALTALCGLLLFGVGCETDPATGFTQSCLTFIADQGLTPGEVTPIWGPESTCERAEVELKVSDVSDVWSVSFELEYPEELALFSSATFGDSFLRSDSNPLVVNTEVQFEDLDGDINTPDQAVLVVGIARTDTSANAGLDTAASPDASLIIRLAFIRIASAGEGEMIFHNPVIEMVENIDDLPSDIVPPVRFSGGRFFIEN